jgi:hypothetical protein
LEPLRPVRKAYPRRAIIRPPAVDELLRIHLLRTWVNKARKIRAVPVHPLTPNPTSCGAEKEALWCICASCAYTLYRRDDPGYLLRTGIRAGLCGG